MRALIVDDHNIFRKAFIGLLKMVITPIPVCVEAENGNECLRKLQESHFDVIFLDVKMPGMNGVETCKYVRNNYPNLPVIILTQCEDENLIFYFFDLGIHSFLTKCASVEEIVAAFESIGSGEKYFPGEIDKIIRERKNSSIREFQRKIELTVREKHLIQLLQHGKTSKEIAEEMNVSLNTINTYRDRLFEKTGTYNAAQLISFCFKIGILK